MDCLRCKAVMISVKLYGGALGERPYLSNKRDGVWEKERQSGLRCFVCPACGHVELQAESPEELILK